MDVILEVAIGGVEVQTSSGKVKGLFFLVVSGLDGFVGCEVLIVAPCVVFGSCVAESQSVIC